MVFHHFRKHSVKINLFLKKALWPWIICFYFTHWFLYQYWLRTHSCWVVKRRVLSAFRDLSVHLVDNSNIGRDEETLLGICIGAKALGFSESIYDQGVKYEDQAVRNDLIGKETNSWRSFSVMVAQVAFNLQVMRSHLHICVWKWQNQFGLYIGCSLQYKITTFP